MCSSCESINYSRRSVAKTEASVRFATLADFEAKNIEPCLPFFLLNVTHLEIVADSEEVARQFGDLLPRLSGLVALSFGDAYRPPREVHYYYYD